MIRKENNNSFLNLHVPQAKSNLVATKCSNNNNNTNEDALSAFRLIFTGRRRLITTQPLHKPVTGVFLVEFKHKRVPFRGTLDLISGHFDMRLSFTLLGRFRPPFSPLLRFPIDHELVCTQSFHEDLFFIHLRQGKEVLSLGCKTASLCEDWMKLFAMAANGVVSQRELEILKASYKNLFSWWASSTHELLQAKPLLVVKFSAVFPLATRFCPHCAYFLSTTNSSSNNVSENCCDLCSPCSKSAGNAKVETMAHQAKQLLGLLTQDWTRHTFSQTEFLLAKLKESIVEFQDGDLDPRSFCVYSLVFACVKYTLDLVHVTLEDGRRRA